MHISTSMGAPINTIEPENQKGPVLREIDRQIDLAAAFHEEISKLERNLAPILGSGPAPDGDKKAPEVLSTCPLHEAQLGNSSEFRAAFTRLASLRERIRL